MVALTPRIHTLMRCAKDIAVIIRTTLEPLSPMPRGSFKEVKMICKMPLAPLVLLIQASNSTVAVSTMSHTAHHTGLIMVSWLLDTALRMDRTTTLSRTPGAPDGDWEDTSKCPETEITNVALLLWPVMPLPHLTLSYS